jgi:apolipoprotein N-acyltransferase
VSLAPLIVAVVLSVRQPAPAPRPFWLGLTTGVVYFVGTLYWIGEVMAAHGDLSPLVAYPLMSGLAVHLGLFVGLFAYLLGRAVRRFGMAGVWLSPVLWVASEWTRVWLGWQFPWVVLGSSQAAVVPVVQLASVTGVYGLSALLALTATAAAALALSRKPAHRRGAAIVAVIVISNFAWGTWRVTHGALLTSGNPMRVGLLQGNVLQEDKQNPALRDAILDRYVSLSRQAIAGGAQLVLWPEASAPFYFDFDANLAAPVRRLAVQARVPFVIGTDDFERGVSGQPDRYYNAAVLVGTDGRSRSTYRKILLVPFGEYVPFKRLLFFVGPLIEAVSDFTPGQALTVFESEGSRFSVAICYEAVYAGMAQAFVSNGSQLLTTITNDAWFGRSSAAFQHFDQAALRAVEQGRYMVRAANTGISGAVDPYGRVIARSTLFEASATVADVRLLSGWTIYHAVGDVVVWISLAMAGAVLWMARRPKDKQP